MSYENEQKKKQFPDVLRKHYGIVAYALQALDLPRCTYHRWYKKDPLFANMVNDVMADTTDYVEGKLMTLISKEHFPAISFYLRKKGKDRGWGDDENIRMAEEILDSENDRKILKRFEIETLRKYNNPPAEIITHEDK